MKKLSRKKANEYFKELEIIEQNFHKKLSLLESIMAEETGIKDIEFFWCDNSIVGIGNTSRTMKLIQRYEYR